MLMAVTCSGVVMAVVRQRSGIVVTSAHHDGGERRQRILELKRSNYTCHAIPHDGRVKKRMINTLEFL